MKLLKYYNWEEAFVKRNLEIRREEIKNIRKIASIKFFFQLLYLFGQIGILTLTYWSFVALGGELSL